MALKLVLLLLAMFCQSSLCLTTTNAFLGKEVPRETFRNPRELQTDKLAQCAIKCRHLQGGCSAITYKEEDRLCVLGDFRDTIVIGNLSETTIIYLMDDFIKWGRLEVFL